MKKGYTYYFEPWPGFSISLCFEGEKLEKHINYEKTTWLIFQVKILTSYLNYFLMAISFEIDSEIRLTI